VVAAPRKYISFVISLAAAVAIATSTGCAGPGVFVWYSDLPKPEWGVPSSEYTIGSGDTISIKVYEQEGLSMNGKVRSDGRMALPLVGEVVASGKRPIAFAKELEIKFKEFIVSPRVTVNVENSLPVTVTMMGEVAKAGELKLEAPASLLQAVGQAGGPSEYADRSRIFVLRRFPEYKRIRFTWDSLVHNDKGAALFALRSGDIVYIE
jgi:polysaccharide biosynthesis/export protein